MADSEIVENVERTSASSSIASINFEGPSVSHVRASRDRCENLYDIDPHSSLLCNRFSESEVGLRLEKVEEPLARARPLIHEIRSIVKNANYCMLIADDECAAVAEYHDTDLARYLKKQGIAVGTVWDESWVGTNGIGTSTADTAAVTINGEEHYHRNFHQFICSAAPLIDHRGRRYGALNLTGTATSSQTEVIRVSQFVRRAAAKFHSYVFRDYFQNHRLIAIADERFNDVDKMSKMLAVDDSGCVIGVTDDLLSSLKTESREALMGKSLQKVIGLDFEKLLASEERLHRLEEGAIGGRYALNLPPSNPHRNKITGKRTSQRAQKLSTSSNKSELLQVQGVLNGAGPTLDELAGNDKRMQKQVALCRRMLDGSVSSAASADMETIPLLLQGETGTGKDTFAKALHGESPRQHMPYIELNCAAIPDSLIDSELFGYAPGTFTGGLKDGKDGYIVAANGGTLFLDEIGDMPLESQTRLLRVLSERVVQPLGAANTVSVDFALVCASHRDLQELVRTGRFREDLYYRVCGAKITLPSLRERSDLMSISRLLLRQFDPQGSVELSDGVWQKLADYPWPGNIRQLKNTLQYIVYSCSDGLATDADLPDDLLLPPVTMGINSMQSVAHVTQSYPSEQDNHHRSQVESEQSQQHWSKSPSCGSHPVNLNLPQISEQAPLSKRDELLRALHQTRWCVAKAARVVGVSRATVHRQMKKYGIVRPDHQGL